MKLKTILFFKIIMFPFMLMADYVVLPSKDLPPTNLFVDSYPLINKSKSSTVRFGSNVEFQYFFFTPDFEGGLPVTLCNCGPRNEYVGFDFTLLEDSCSGTTLDPGERCDYRFTLSRDESSPDPINPINFLDCYTFDDFDSDGVKECGSNINPPVGRSFIDPPDYENLPELPQCGPKVQGSVIDPMNQTVSKSIPVKGTNYELVYSSSRMFDFVTPDSFEINQFESTDFVLSSYAIFNEERSILHRGDGSYDVIANFDVVNGKNTIFDWTTNTLLTFRADGQIEKKAVLS